ncbi:uncharacterized protein [Miscanthus floridulus]|uniref:uncharacterized protein isoform X4 n=1 Tax=Miscanthus floridulus TaxID=154761 RepID=UPI003459446E
MGELTTPSMVDLAPSAMGRGRGARAAVHGGSRRRRRWKRSCREGSSTAAMGELATPSMVDLTPPAMGKEEQLMPPSMVELAPPSMRGGRGARAAIHGGRKRISCRRPWWSSRRRPWGGRGARAAIHGEEEEELTRAVHGGSRAAGHGGEEEELTTPSMVELTLLAMGEEEELVPPSMVDLAPPAMGRKRSSRRYPWGRGRGACAAGHGEEEEEVAGHGKEGARPPPLAHGEEAECQAKLDLSNKLPPIGVIEAKIIARKQWLVAGDWDGYIHVYCYKAMQQLAHFKAHLHIQDLAVHPTEPYVLSACVDKGNVKLWDWEKGWECTRIFEFADFDHVYGLTFLNIKDTDTFAVRGDAGIKVCSHRSAGSAEFILSEYNDPDIYCFDYFANGGHHYLIIGGNDGIVKIRDLHTKSLVQTVEGVHLGSVYLIYCHPEHPVLVTGSEDGTVCLWNPTTLRPERTFNFGLREVHDVKVCMDSSRSYRVVIAHRKGLAMIEIDQNDLVVVNTGSSSEENDLVGSRKRKLSEPDQSEIENEENDFVVDVMDTGNGAEQTQGNGSTDEEIHSVSSNLLDVYPVKLQLPFKPNKLTSCSVKLRNTTDDHIAVRLLTKCPKRYMAKMPLCCIVPPNCMYTFIVTGSDQKKRPLLSRDEFLTLESTICLKEDIVGLQNANVDSAAMEFTNFFKEAKEMAADKQVHELKLSVVSDPLKETTSVQSEVEVVSNRKFSHVLSVDVHPTGPWILTTNQAGEVLIWDYKAQAIAISFDFTQKQVYSAKFIVGEEWIVAGDGYGTIYVYSYQTEEEVTSFDAHDSDITSLAVHPTDPLVLSSSEDRLIKLWDWKKNWECTRTFEGHSDRVTHVNFNPIGTSSFASASLDHTIKVWNISSPESIITTLSDHPDGLVCIHSYRSDMKQYLIAGSCDGTAQIWDMETRRLVQTLKGHARHISCVYHHPELPVVITGSHEGTVRLWNSTTYRLESIVGINLGVVHALGYIKDLRRIAIGCHQGIAIMGVNYS